LRVPVDALAFVTATGLASVPILADEFERLRIAQAARGITRRGRGPVARARLVAMLQVPLVVLAYRRAHQMADSLVVRGFDPSDRARTQTAWRAQRIPATDIAALIAAAALIVAV